MEDYSIRIKQLNDYKVGAFFKYFFFLILSILVEIGIYHLIKFVINPYENINESAFVFLNGIVYFLISQPTMLWVHKFHNKQNNKNKNKTTNYKSFNKVCRSQILNLFF